MFVLYLCFHNDLIDGLGLTHAHGKVGNEFNPRNGSLSM